VDHQAEKQRREAARDKQKNKIAKGKIDKGEEAKEPPELKDKLVDLGLPGCGTLLAREPERSHALSTIEGKSGT